MSSIELLDGTRRIRALLHDNPENKVSFDDICSLMGSIVPSSVCLVSAKGKMLGRDSRAIYPDIFGVQKGTFIDDTINDRLLRVLSTRENVRLDTLGIADKGVLETEMLITPVELGGARSGTLLFFRRNRDFNIDDIILCEYASTVISLELKRSLDEEEASKERFKSDIEDAIAALSATEKQAVGYVLESLGVEGGIVVASQIAKDHGITRSVIVNALKKLESAGIISTKSAGVKGTHVKVLNDGIFDRVDILQN